MSEISPPIAPEHRTVTSDAEALLELVGHLGAALLQSNLDPFGICAASWSTSAAPSGKRGLSGQKR